MKEKLLVIVMVLATLTACKKEQPAVDLSYLCDKGDLWLVDKKDSFNPSHSVDSFYFSQAGGYHRFFIKNSDVNYLELEVLTKPDVGHTTIYKSMFIRSLKGNYIAQAFNYSNTKDSMLTISNMGTHYEITLLPVSVKLTDTTTHELRICKLKMTDIVP